MVESLRLPSQALVQWVQRGNPYLLDGLALEGPVGALGCSILDAAPLDTTLAAARERGLGVLVDTEPHRTQLECDHPHRAAYRRSGLDWPAEASSPRERRFDPEQMRLSEAAREELLARHRDAQAAAGSTIFHWAGHRVRDAASLSAGRRGELALAADFLSLARSSGATYPAPRSSKARRVAVGLTIDAKDLGPRVAAELSRAYAQLDPDLFWINCWNFNQSARQYVALRYLARSLQRESRVPCLLAGIGSLWEAALRNQVAAVCQGWGRGRMRFPPPPPPPKDEEGNGTPYGVPAYHPAIRGSLALGEKYEEAANVLYNRFPCPCGQHEGSRHPESQRERHLHNRYWAELLAEGAIAGDPAQTTTGLRAIVAAAEELRAELGLGRLPQAWRSACSDPSDGKRIELPIELWRPPAARSLIATSS